MKIACRDELYHNVIQYMYGNKLEFSFTTCIITLHITIQAAENNDKDSAQQWLQWLEQNPTKERILDDQDESGNTAAHLAAKLNRVEILHMMLTSKLGG